MVTNNPEAFRGAASDEGKLPYALQADQVEPALPQIQARMVAILEDCPVIPLAGIGETEKMAHMANVGKQLMIGTGKAACIEVLLRSDSKKTLEENQADMLAGFTKIRELKERHGDNINILVGSVLSADDVRAAFDAGADGIVSGAYIPDVHQKCQALGMPYLPAFHGANENEQAIDNGFKVIKAFPAKAEDKTSAIKAMKAPLSRLNVQFYTSQDEIPAGQDVVKVKTPTEVMAAVADGHKAVFLDPLVLDENDIAKNDRNLEDTDVRACCTGGVTSHNIIEFGARQAVLGAGASYLGKAQDLFKEWGYALKTWENAKAPAPDVKSAPGF